MIRSVYRTIELSQGYIGYLATHEVYFLCLDTLPLFLGISAYTWFWPAKYLTEDTKIVNGTNEHQRALGEGAEHGQVMGSETERSSNTPIGMEEVKRS